MWNVEERIQTRVFRKRDASAACVFAVFNRPCYDPPPRPTSVILQPVNKLSAHKGVRRMRSDSYFAHIRQEGLSPTVMRGIDDYCS